MIGAGYFQNKTLTGLKETVNSNLKEYPDLSHLIKGDEGGEDQVILTFLPHVLAVIIIVAVASRILHLSLRYVRMPLIVCQMISGILIFSFISKPKDEISIDNEIIISPANRRLEYVIGIIGILFTMFLAGVKLDYSMVWQFKKKEPFIIGSASLFIPLAVGSLFYALHYEYLQRFLGEKKVAFLLYILHPLCTTYPITQSDMFTELGLLNSDLGRLALSSSMTQCVIGWAFVITFTVYRHASAGLVMGLKTFLSFLGLFIIIMLVIMPYTRWLVRTTPPNARVRDMHLFLITIAVFVVALISDTIGFTYIDGPVIMGLTMPPGPPLGTSLIEWVDLVPSEMFLPVAFMNEGLYIDWPGLKQKLGFAMRIQLLVIVTFITKIAANTAAAMYCDKTLKEGILLGLMMNFRGLIDMLAFLSLKRIELIDKATFTAFVVPIIVITAICAPLVSFFYKPLDGKKEIRHRAIQNVHFHAELRVMTCFYDDKPIPTLLEFLKYVSSPDQTDNLLCIYTLHLIELQARYTSSLICHRNKNGHINPTQMDAIHNHFINFQRTKKDGVITVVPFISMTPLKTMDVCSLVLERNIAFVLVPYPKKHTMADMEGVEAMRGFVPLVLEEAQCSIGIMVYHGITRVREPKCLQYHIGVLFWGGPDDREGIAIASRLARHPDVYLNTLCFLISYKKDGQQRKYESLDKEYDDKAIAEFRAANAANNHVTITKNRVGNLEEAFSVIHTLKNKYDLLIVGRRQEWMLMQDENLEQWIESPELGLVGDMLATDISCTANVLVVQQHKL
ncbi:hypothetical protein LUZ60_002053 [Juncus effusus]|nr:hypothetical protein LUZ60_002053 [Juncus effusus]